MKPLAKIATASALASSALLMVAGTVTPASAAAAKNDAKTCTSTRTATVQMLTNSGTYTRKLTSKVTVKLVKGRYAAFANAEAKYTAKGSARVMYYNYTCQTKIAYPKVNYSNTVVRKNQDFGSYLTKKEALAAPGNWVKNVNRDLGRSQAWAKAQVKIAHDARRLVGITAPLIVKTS